MIQHIDNAVASLEDDMKDSAVTQLVQKKFGCHGPLVEWNDLHQTKDFLPIYDAHESKDHGAWCHTTLTESWSRVERTELSKFIYRLRLTQKFSLLKIDGILRRWIVTFNHAIDWLRVLHVFSSSI
jgi:hypothetical protein